MNTAMLRLLFIPLFFIISVPGDPVLLGFTQFETVKGNKIKVNWEQLRLVLGNDVAIAMANDYWKHKQKGLGGYWLEHNTHWTKDMKAAISVDAVLGKEFKPVVKEAPWKKAISTAFKVATTPINLGGLVEMFGYRLVSI